MAKDISDKWGAPVGFHDGKAIYNLYGRIVGRLRGSHVYCLAGHHVGKLQKGILLNKSEDKKGKDQNCGSTRAPAERLRAMADARSIRNRLPR